MNDDPILELRHIEILEHALGITNRRIPANITRRSFVAEKGTADHSVCLALERMDYMRVLHTSALEDDLEMFRVTDECIELLRNGEKLKRLIEGDQQIEIQEIPLIDFDSPANAYTMRPEMHNKDAVQQKKRGLFLMRKSTECLGHMTLIGKLRWLRDLVTALGEQEEEEREGGASEFFRPLARLFVYGKMPDGRDAWDISDND